MADETKYEVGNIKKKVWEDLGLGHLDLDTLIAESAKFADASTELFKNRKSLTSRHEEELKELKQRQKKELSDLDEALETSSFTTLNEVMLFLNKCLDEYDKLKIEKGHHDEVMQLISSKKEAVSDRLKNHLDGVTSELDNSISDCQSKLQELNCILQGPLLQHFVEHKDICKKKIMYHNLTRLQTVITNPCVIGSVVPTDVSSVEQSSNIEEAFQVSETCKSGLPLNLQEVYGKNIFCTGIDEAFKVSTHEGLAETKAPSPVALDKSSSSEQFSHIDKSFIRASDYSNLSPRLSAAIRHTL